MAELCKAAKPSSRLRWSYYRWHDFVLPLLAHPVSYAPHPDTQAPVFVLGQDRLDSASGDWNGTSFVFAVLVAVLCLIVVIDNLGSPEGWRKWGLLQPTKPGTWLRTCLAMALEYD